MSNTTHFGDVRVAPHVRDAKPTGKWVVDVPKSLAGKRYRRFFDTCEEANETAVLLNRRFAKRGSLAIGVLGQDLEQSLRLKSAIRLWVSLQHRRVALGKKKQSSLDTDLIRLKHTEEFFGDVPLEQIDRNFLEDFQLKRMQNGMKPTTVNSDIRAIKKVLNWAYKEGHLRRTIYIDKVPEDRKRKVLPTLDEVRRIIQSAAPATRTIIRLLAETGCRRGEILNLAWGDVNLEERTIAIQSKDGWTPKTRHSQRTLRISDGVAEELSKLPRKSQWVFPGPDPSKARLSIKRSFSTALRKAAISRNGEPLHVRVHDLRAFCATHLRDVKKVSKHIVQDHLGHVPGSPVTDEHYHGRTEIDLDQCVLDIED